MADPIPFRHFHSAHCESGVTASLLSHAGAEISEPLVFGIAAGLFFLHVPFKSLFGNPNTNFRSAPGSIFRKTCKRLGVDFEVRTFGNDVAAGTQALEQMVAAGQPVGIQTNVFWLSHMPRRFRFQFNAHNLVVFGRDAAEGWRVSDPVLEQPLWCTAPSMARARFAKGLLAPKGKMYFVKGKPSIAPERLREAVREGILDASKGMSRIPLPWFGGKAINLLADRMERWPQLYDAEEALRQLTNVVRMQEEIGTGGAGFRYLYAAFLQQAAPVLGDPKYLAFSQTLTDIGDTWRQFAAKCARICRSHKAEAGPFAEAAALVRDCGNRERALFSEILAHELARGRVVHALPAGQ